MARPNPKTQQAQGNWKQFKGRIQEKWGDLTGDDLDRYEGQRKQLEGYIEEQTGEKREHIRKEIDRMANETKYRV